MKIKAPKIPLIVTVILTVMGILLVAFALMILVGGTFDLPK